MHPEHIAHALNDSTMYGLTPSSFHGDSLTNLVPFLGNDNAVEGNSIVFQK